MNTYVVSPSASGEGTADQYVPFIKKHHIAVMGWSVDDPEDTKETGRLFHDIPIGALIIIAYGKNSSKTVIGAGFVDSESRIVNEDGINCAQGRHLKYFCDLSNSQIPFSVECKYGNKPGNWIPSCYQLSDSEADQKVVDAVINKLNKNKQDEYMEELCRLLENCHNLILTGAPGTGKTYLAKKIAYFLTGDTPENHPHVEFVQFHPSYDYTDFVEGLRPTLPEENGNVGFTLRNGTFKVFCEKAISSSLDNVQDNFEDAWQNLMNTLNEKDYIKITNLSGNGEFDVELNEYGTGLASRTYASDEEKANHNWINGRSRFFSKEQLYNIYKGLPGVPAGGHDNYRKAVINKMKSDFGLLDYRAGIQNDSEKQKYVFIIDEINRGDIAKIFGELFFAIDPGYRGVTGQIKTQYGSIFYIPKNVYIIGTMNDIDRNVESMDFAIRRRFTWKQITPEDTQDAILTELGADIEEARTRMNRLNAAIRAKESQLGENYCIGASYFSKIDNTPEKWDNLWNYHLKPLLAEYVRGLPEADELMNKFKSAYNGK